MKQAVDPAPRAHGAPTLRRAAAHWLRRGCMLLPMAALPLAPAPGGAAPALAPAGRTLPVLLVTQAVAGPQDRASSVVQVQVAHPAGTRRSASMVAYDLAGAPRAGFQFGIDGVAVQDYGLRQLSRAAIARAAAARLDVATLRVQLDRALAATGAPVAFFSFTQQVVPADAGIDPANAAAPLLLTWLLVRDRRGVETWGPPRVRTDQPLLLLATYTPRAAAREVPARFAYADAGRLALQLVDARLQPVRALGTLDTGGAFDAPDPPDGQPFDPEQQVRCLADARHPGCAPGSVDLHVLAAQSGADAAILDYRMRLAAATADAREVAPDGTASVVQVPLAGVTVTARQVLPNGCTAETVTYRNEGRRGFVLQAEARRYLVVSGPGAADLPAAPRLLGVQADRVLVPQAPYAKQRPIARSVALALGDTIIEPLGEDTGLVAARDVPGLIDLPAVQVLAQPSTLLLDRVSAALPLLGDATGHRPQAPAWHNTVTCRPDGTLFYEAISAAAAAAGAAAPALDPDTGQVGRYGRAIAAGELRQACAQDGGC